MGISTVYHLSSLVMNTVAVTDNFSENKFVFSCFYGVQKEAFWLKLPTAAEDGRGFITPC